MARSPAATEMTAAQVAEKSGLPRATVSTTLSRLAKSGEIRKAPRGYRLAFHARAVRDLLTGGKPGRHVSRH